MMTFDPIEIDVLMEFFAPDGYVLDLSDERFNELTQQTVGVRVKELYADERLSKGKSLRRFVMSPGNEGHGYKLLTTLMRYYELKIKDTDSPSTRPEALYRKCKDILKEYAPLSTNESPRTRIDEAGKMPPPSMVDNAGKQAKPFTFIVSPPVKTSTGYDRKIEWEGGVYHDLMDDAEYYEELEAEIQEECDRRVKLIDLNAESERRYRELMARLEQPITATVGGFNAQGKREAVVIANTKMKERDFFSDANLRLLFEVSENVPYNWRTGKSPAPEGFAEAFAKKDYAAMQKCAEKYKVNRAKSDAMNTKGVLRNISDEQMKKMGARMPDDPYREPQ